jgi:formylglycine-generating enzyme required for sulfatase activity
LHANYGDKYPAYFISDLRDQRTMESNDLGEIWKDFRGLESQYKSLLIAESKEALNPNENGDSEITDPQNELIATVRKMLSRLSNCGRSDEALQRLDKFEGEKRQTGITTPSNLFLFQRATCLARLGRREELNSLMQDIIRASSIDEEDKLLLQVRLAVLEDTLSNALTRLQALEVDPSESSKLTAKLLENQVRGLALVSIAAKNAGSSEFSSIKSRLIIKARAFLNRSDADKILVLDCDFDGLRNDKEWTELLDTSQLTHRVTMAFAVRPKFESRLLPAHNDPDFNAADHRAQASRLLAEGFRPEVLEYHKANGKKERILSIWVRDSLTHERASRRARSIASLSLALAYLDQINEVIPGLEDRHGRSVQTALIASLPKVLPPMKLIEIYQSNASPKLHASLISSLGEIPWNEIDSASQIYLRQTLPNIVRTSDDPHLASLAKWACNVWNIHSDGAMPIELAANLARRSTTSVGQEMIRIDGRKFVLEKLDLIQQQRINRDTPIDAMRLPLRVWCKLDRDFNISATEVTGRQFQQFLDDPDPKVQDWLHNVYSSVAPIVPTEGDMPQSKVSWHLAIRYCQWLNEKESIPKDQWCYENVWSKNLKHCKPKPNYLRLSGYRLPTLAEWTWACSGGTSEDWHFGSDEKHVDMYEWTLPHSNEEAQPVSRLRPNAFGLFDMGGNLAEWIDTKFKQPKRLLRRYHIIDVGNPTELEFDSDFILCGGRFSYSSNSAISNSMIRDPADFQAKTTGFRVVQTIIKD